MITNIKIHHLDNADALGLGFPKKHHYKIMYTYADLFTEEQYVYHLPSWNLLSEKVIAELIYEYHITGIRHR